MSDWDETAQVVAECLTAQARMPKVTAEYVEPILVEMALLQRKLLLSDESIERAALGIHASHDRGDWDEELPVVQGEYRDMARAALTGALGEDKSDE